MKSDAVKKLIKRHKDIPSVLSPIPYLDHNILTEKRITSFTKNIGGQSFHFYSLIKSKDDFSQNYRETEVIFSREIFKKVIYSSIPYPIGIQDFFTMNTSPVESSKTTFGSKLLPLSVEPFNVTITPVSGTFRIARIPSYHSEQISLNMTPISGEFRAPLITTTHPVYTTMNVKPVSGVFKLGSIKADNTSTPETYTQDLEPVKGFIDTVRPELYLKLDTKLKGYTNDPDFVLNDNIANDVVSRVRRVVPEDGSDPYTVVRNYGGLYLETHRKNVFPTLERPYKVEFKVRPDTVNSYGVIGLFGFTSTNTTFIGTTLDLSLNLFEWNTVSIKKEAGLSEVTVSINNQDKDVEIKTYQELERRINFKGDSFSFKDFKLNTHTEDTPALEVVASESNLSKDSLDNIGSWSKEGILEVVDDYLLFNGNSSILNKDYTDLQVHHNYNNYRVDIEFQLTRDFSAETPVQYLIFTGDPNQSLSLGDRRFTRNINSFNSSVEDLKFFSMELAFIDVNAYLQVIYRGTLIRYPVPVEKGTRYKVSFIRYKNYIHLIVNNELVNSVRHLTERNQLIKAYHRWSGYRTDVHTIDIPDLFPTRIGSRIDTSVIERFHGRVYSWKFTNYYEDKEGLTPSEELFGTYRSSVLNFNGSSEDTANPKRVWKYLRVDQKYTTDLNNRSYIDTWTESVIDTLSTKDPFLFNVQSNDFTFEVITKVPDDREGSVTLKGSFSDELKLTPGKSNTFKHLSISRQGNTLFVHSDGVLVRHERLETDKIYDFSVGGTELVLNKVMVDSVRFINGIGLYSDREERKIDKYLPPVPLDNVLFDLSYDGYDDPSSSDSKKPIASRYMFEKNMVIVNPESLIVNSEDVESIYLTPHTKRLGHNTVDLFHIIPKKSPRIDNQEDFTLEFNFKLDAYNGIVLSFTNGVVLKVDREGYLVLSLLDEALIRADKPLNLNTWYDISIIRINSIVTIYIDGFKSTRVIKDFVLDEDLTLGSIDADLYSLQLLKGVGKYVNSYIPDTRRFLKSSINFNQKTGFKLVNRYSGDVLLEGEETPYRQLVWNNTSKRYVLRLTRTDDFSWEFPIIDKKADFIYKVSDIKDTAILVNNHLVKDYSGVRYNGSLISVDSRSSFSTDKNGSYYNPLGVNSTVYTLRDSVVKVGKLSSEGEWLEIEEVILHHRRSNYKIPSDDVIDKVKISAVMNFSNSDNLVPPKSRFEKTGSPLLSTERSLYGDCLVLENSSSIEYFNIERISSNLFFRTWVFLNSAEPSQSILEVNIEENVDKGYKLVIENGHLILYIGKGTYTKVDSNLIIHPGSWVNIGFSVLGTTIKFFLNGSEYSKFEIESDKLFTETVANKIVYGSFGNLLLDHSYLELITEEVQVPFNPLKLLFERVSASLTPIPADNLNPTDSFNFWETTNVTFNSELKELSTYISAENLASGTLTRTVNLDNIGDLYNRSFILTWDEISTGNGSIEASVDVLSDDFSSLLKQSLISEYNSKKEFQRTIRIDVDSTNASQLELSFKLDGSVGIKNIQLYIIGEIVYSSKVRNDISLEHTSIVDEDPSWEIVDET